MEKCYPFPNKANLNIGLLSHPLPEQLQRLYRHYAASISLIDEQIGEIFDALENKGYLDDSIIIFTSDHGDCLGEHGHIQKWTMYDCITRVPMIVCAPSRLDSNIRCDALLQQMDLVPMLFELAGVQLDDCHSAISALSALQDEKNGRDIVFAEYSDNNNMLQGVELMTMARTREWKLVHYSEQDYGELYDLINDPDEIHNLWDDCSYANSREEMMEKLSTWRRDQNVA